MKKKLLFFSVLLICLLLLPPLTVAAEEPTPTVEDTPTGAASATTDNPPDSHGEDEAHSEGDGGEAAAISCGRGESADSGAGTPSLCQLLLDGLERYTPEILSAMALVSSLLLLLGYKRGFLPLLQGGLGKLCGAVRELGAQTEAHRASADGLASDVSERIRKTESHLSTVGETLRQLEDKLPCAAETERHLRDVETVLLSQVDMLYELFLSTSLPQYRKDGIGERVSAMRAALQAGRTTEGEAQTHER